jgi:LAGLIDADG DNA endonuclease family protein
VELEDCEVAWAAGFFDAEGTISYSESGRYALVSIGQTSRDPLERFRCAVGCGHTIGPYRREGPGRWSKRSQYDFKAYRQDEVVRIATTLWPHLGGPKRTQARLVNDRLVIHRQKTLDVALLGQVPRKLSLRVRVDLAWAAGFFDGEGCFSYVRSSRYPCVSITQTEPGILDRFRSVLGVGKIYGPYTSKVRDGWRRKPHYFYRAHGFADVQAIAGMLWFALGTIKRTQACQVLAQRSRTCRRGHPKVLGHSGCGTCTAEYWAARREGRLFL